jgi:hypothetical protein
MFGPNSSIRGAIAVTKRLPVPERKLPIPFDPKNSSFHCSRDLQSHTPFNPFKHHGNGYVSLVAMAQASLDNGNTTHEFTVTSHPSTGTVKFKVGNTEYEVDKDLIPESCILNNTIRLTIASDHSNQVTSLAVLRNDFLKHFTLRLNRNMGSGDTLIDLIEHSKSKECEGGKYIGELINGKMTDDTGNATFTWYKADGSKKAEYKGKYSNAQRTDDTGNATYTRYHSDGSKKEYKGRFSNGQRTDDTGNATYTTYHADGSKEEYKGRFSNGQRTDDTGNATYTMYNADGIKKAEYKGRFSNDQRTDDTGNATYTRYNADGSKEEYKGKYSNGQRTDDTGNATYTMYNADGSKEEYKGRFSNGQMTDDTGNATFTLYNADGSKEEYKGKYSNGQRTDDTGNATFTLYNADGSKKAACKCKFIDSQMSEFVSGIDSYQDLMLFMGLTKTNSYFRTPAAKEYIASKVFEFKSSVTANPDFIKSLCLLNFSTPSSQRNVLSAVSPEQAEILIRSMLIQDHSTVFSHPLTTPPNLFGTFGELSYGQNEELIEGFNVTYCLEEKIYGSVGVICGADGTRYLLVYDTDKNVPSDSRFASQESPDLKEAEERFKGLLNADPNDSHLYLSGFKNLTLFRLENTPILMDLTQVAQDFTKYPIWLQDLIKRYVPSIEDFKSKEIIEPVFYFIDQQGMNEGDKLQIKECILRIFEGKGFYPGILGAALSEKFNRLLPVEITNEADPSYVKSFNEFWNSATSDKKIKLILLFLTLASSHGLGYGHGGANDGGQNESNKMFYVLSTIFLRKLKNEYTGIESVPAIITQVLQNCEQGLCAGLSAQIFQNYFISELSVFWQKEHL